MEPAIKKNDTIAIIGGGIAGLTAGAFLAQRGLKVLLFEARSKPGGCCSTTVLKGFTFNDGALYILLPEILQLAFERLGLDISSLLTLNRVTADHITMFPNSTMVTIQQDWSIIIERENKILDSTRFQHELDHLRNKWTPLLRLMTDDLAQGSFSPTRLIRKVWRHLGKIRGSVATELKSLISNEFLRSALSGALLFSGSPPEKSPVISILGLIAFLNNGLYLPEGGMGKISEVLSRAMTANGGEIFLNSKVNRILIKNGHACGLLVNDQGAIPADAVLSTTGGLSTFNTLLDPQDTPPSMRTMVRNAPQSHKILNVQLGLSNQIGIDSYQVNLIPAMEQQYQMFEPDDEEVKWFNYFITTASLPEFAPSGGSVVELGVPISQDIAAADWDENKKERLAEAAIQALSRLHALDIAVKRVRSPRDFQEQLHLYDGGIYGISPIAGLRALFPHKTPIPGLFQAGQTTYPGFGVNMASMSGIYTSEALLRDLT